MGRIQNECKKCYRFEQQDKLGVYLFIFVEINFIILFLIWKNTMYVENIIMHCLRMKDTIAIL